MPVKVRELLRAASATDDVDASWQIWSSEVVVPVIRRAVLFFLSIATWKVEVGYISALKGHGAVPIAPIMRMNLMLPALGSSLTLHLPRSWDSAVDSSQSTMPSKASGQPDFRTPARPARLLSGIASLQLPVWDPLVPQLPLNHGLTGSPLSIFMGFFGGFWMLARSTPILSFKLLGVGRPQEFRLGPIGFVRTLHRGRTT